VVLFTKIAGLVTDTGGTTSHPAVLAREFGIPAVIGTSVATHRIATGDRVRVDGSMGTVEILERASGAAGAAGATGKTTASAATPGASAASDASPATTTPIGS
jgi:phosphoenolpyruvate-protein kinase (PTS system EI component)